MLPKSGEVVLQGSQTPREAARFRVEATHVDSPAAKPEMEGWIHFAQLAEEAGIESVLVALNRHEPDPLMISCALGRATKKLKFIVAYRTGLMQPTIFVQQVNTLSGLIEGRVALNIVAGSSTAEQKGYGDFLDHDERYARADEFLEVCHSFWRGEEVAFRGDYFQVESGQLSTPFLAPDRSAPEIYVSGHSEQAERLAQRRGSAWLRLADTPEKLTPLVERNGPHRIELCLRVCAICRPTHDEAVSVARAMLPDEEIERQERGILSGSDSQTLKQALAAADEVGWLNKNLWAGLVPFYGSSAMTLVGSYQDLAEAFLAYKDIGITQFIISGWPKLDEVMIFGREVIPLIRERQRLCS